MQNKNSIPLAGFYSSDTKGAISLSGITVYGVGAPGDSTILNNAQSVTQVYLPMPISGNSVDFVFHYTQSDISNPLYNDTLSIDYTPIPYFASKECGAMYIYRINDFRYTRHIVDSVAILVPEITNMDTETIRLFFKTSTPQSEN